jgi:hypothetical protein
MTDHELLSAIFIMNFIVLVFTITKALKDNALNNATMHNPDPTYPKPPSPPAPPPKKCSCGCD